MPASCNPLPADSGGLPAGSGALPGDPGPSHPGPGARHAGPGPSPAGCEQSVTLTGDLHARPAGALAVAAGKFAATVSLRVGDNLADAKSVLGVMALGATTGQHVTVSATGPDAAEAVSAVISALSEATRVGA